MFLSKWLAQRKMCCSLVLFNCSDLCVYLMFKCDGVFVCGRTLIAIISELLSSVCCVHIVFWSATMVWARDSEGSVDKNVSSLWNAILRLSKLMCRLSHGWATHPYWLEVISNVHQSTWVDEWISKLLTPLQTLKVMMCLLVIFSNL